MSRFALRKLRPTTFPDDLGRPQRSGPELVELVLVGIVAAHVGDAPIAKTHHLASSHVEPPARSFTGRMLIGRNSLVSDQHVYQFCPKGAAGESTDLREEVPKDRIPAAVVER